MSQTSFKHKNNCLFCDKPISRDPDPQYKRMCINCIESLATRKSGTVQDTLSQKSGNVLTLNKNCLFCDKPTSTYADSQFDRMCINCIESLATKKSGTVLDTLSQKIKNEPTERKCGLKKEVSKETTIYDMTRDERDLLEKNEEDCSNNEIKKLLSYPPPPARSAITITTLDYSRLKSKFLNDIIIDFYLKYLELEVMNEKERRSCLIFSTFFYTRLTASNPDNKTTDQLQISAEDRHARVRRWTKGDDIFKKDFLIIPINESHHWFLVIICFPGLTGPVRMSDNQADDENKSQSEERDGKSDLNETEAEYQSGREGGHMMGDLANEPIKQPCILIFDSLPNQNRVYIFKTLREYLKVEWQVKHPGEKRDFSQDVFVGAVPKVPQQMNAIDCGVFLLHYVEAFFKNPIKDYRMPMKSLTDWFPNQEVEGKRDMLMKLIVSLAETQGTNIESLNLEFLPGSSGLSPTYEQTSDVICSSKRKKFK